MTQDNKDAALELAEFSDRMDEEAMGAYKAYLLKLDGITERPLDLPDGARDMFCTGYWKGHDAARKPLEEENDEIRSDFKRKIDAAVAVELEPIKQQLLATQEAYQRVVEALKEADGWLEYLNPAALPDDRHRRAFDTFAWAVESELYEGTSPPSLEAVERKKLEDEIAVLDSASKWTHPEAIITEMIVERKAKLEKMK